mmetsp:Transcript_38046/g.95659  ORF Transcript_38046/g.95659 Transcript_38046/m.95659 type:complete len:242 (+) Transcript_38046:2773-3498(+)
MSFTISRSVQQRLGVTQASVVSLQVEEAGAALHQIVHLLDVSVDSAAAVCTPVDQRARLDGKLRDRDQPISTIVDQTHETKIQPQNHATRGVRRESLEFVLRHLHCECISTIETVRVDRIFEEDSVVFEFFSSSDAHVLTHWSNGFQVKRQVSFTNDLLTNSFGNSDKLLGKLLDNGTTLGEWLCECLFELTCPITTRRRRRTVLKFCRGLTDSAADQSISLKHTASHIATHRWRLQEGLH